MATARGLLHAALCIGLAAVGLFYFPFLRAYGAWERAVPAATWLGVALGCVGLVLSAVLAVLASRGRRVRPIVTLLAPLATAVLAAVTWLLGGWSVVGLGGARDYQEALASLTSTGLAAVEVPAVLAVWAALGFVGGALVGASASPPDGGPAARERLRWLAVALGLGAAAGAVVALVGAAPELVYDPRDPRSLNLGPTSLPLVPFMASPLASRLGIVAVALLPVFFLPCWTRLQGLAEREASRLAAARGLAVAGLLGAAVAAVVGAPLWSALARAAFVVTSEHGARFPRACSASVGSTLAAAAAPYVLGGALAVATLLAIGLRRRIRQSLAPLGATVVAVGALLLSGVVSTGRVEAAVGGACGEACTCAQAVAAVLTGQALGPESQPDGPEAVCCCGVGRHAGDASALPEVEGDGVPVPATDIAVTDVAILVDDRLVVDLVDGRIDVANRRGTEPDDIVLPLLDALLEAAQNQRMIARRNEAYSFNDTALLRVTARTRSSVLDAVTVTAPAAGYPRLAALVRRPGVRDSCPFRTLGLSGVRVATRVSTLHAGILSVLDGAGPTDPMGRRAGGRASGSDAENALAAPRGQGIGAEPSAGETAHEEDFLATQGCAQAVLLSAPAVEGLCAGLYWAAGCVGVEVDGERRCGDEALVAEIWRLRVGDGGLHLFPPRGEPIEAEEPEALARELLSRHEEASRLARIVVLERDGNVPVERDLRARAALVGADGRRFVAAIPESLARVGRPAPTPASAASAPASYMETGSPRMDGALSRSTVRRLVRQHVGEVRACYERALAERPELAGQVSLRFRVAPAGEVTACSVASSTLQSPEVDRCIAEAIRGIAFPETETETIVTYPFRFRPLER